MLSLTLLFAALGTTAEINALSHGAFGISEPFSVTGTVSAVLYNSHFVIEDDTGRTHIRSMQPTAVSEGDAVVVDGYTSIDAYRQEQAIVTNLVVRGHGTPPSPHAETVSRIASGEANYANVVVEGTVAGCFPDDIDRNWNYLILCSEGSFTYVSVPNVETGTRRIEDYSRAAVSVRGTVIHGHCGARRVVGPHIETSGFQDITLISPPSNRSIATFPDLNRLSPANVVSLGPQTMEGRVTALWGDSHMLMLDDFEGVHRVDLRTGESLPDVGSRIRVTGLPETDLYRINLSKARCETIDPPPGALTNEFADTSALSPALGIRHINFHGRIVRIAGRIVAEPNARSGWRAILETNERERLAVDISALRERADDLAVGTVVMLTGCGLIETDNWQPGAPFPQQQALVLVVRAPSDIHVVSRPPWWTPRRLLAVIGALFGLLVAFLIWNRALNRLAERRGRQLYREALGHAAAEFRTIERTRLAAEMHDSLSQSLTGISCQIDAMDGARVKRPERLAHHLELARRMLDGCRMQLRNCLWDLRSDILNEPNSDLAIRQTVLPHIGAATLTVDFPIARSAFSDTTFHEILCILRELVANAVRHGKASNISICAQKESDRIVVSVIDNGCGFDPENRPGSAEGHFGLLGVRERLNRLNGTLEISSGPGQGTSCKFTLDTKHG